MISRNAPQFLKGEKKTNGRVKKKIYFIYVTNKVLIVKTFLYLRKPTTYIKI